MRRVAAGIEKARGILAVQRPGILRALDPVRGGDGNGSQRHETELLLGFKGKGDVLTRRNPKPRPVPGLTAFQRTLVVNHSRPSRPPLLSLQSAVLRFL